LKRNRSTMKEALDMRPYCRVCSTTVALHVHHIVERRRTQNDEIDNLCVLCQHCHQLVHDKKIDLGSFLSPEEQAKAVLLTGSISLAEKLLWPTGHRKVAA
jgi:5-methylcytosine-specific restriction endonuclease McrA